MQNNEHILPLVTIGMPTFNRADSYLKDALKSAVSQTYSACDSYYWNGNTYSQTGVYTYSALNQYACDSTVTLHLTITPSSNNTSTASACESYTWSVNGTTYTQSGTYSSTSGCNTEILNLTITPSFTNTSSASACDSYTWAVNGQTYTQSGTYSSVSGCVTNVLTLTITPSSSSSALVVKTLVWDSKRSTIAWLIASSRAGSTSPFLRMAASVTIRMVPAACSAPITAVRAQGQLK